MPPCMPWVQETTSFSPSFRELPIEISQNLKLDVVGQTDMAQWLCLRPSAKSKLLEKEKS